MDQKQVFKQMMELNRMGINSAFNTMEMVQNQAEYLANSILDQATGIPEEGKKAIREWVGAFKKGGTEYKKTVDAAFKQVENFF